MSLVSPIHFSDLPCYVSCGWMVRAPETVRDTYPVMVSTERMRPRRVSHYLLHPFPF